MRIAVAVTCACLWVGSARASVCFTTGGHAVCGDTLERCESLRTRELVRFGGDSLPACGDSAIAVSEPPANGKDPGTAFGLSIGVTAIGLGALIAATTYPQAQHGSALAIGGSGVLLLGPSTGHFYAERPASLGLAIRATGIAMIWVGAWCASGGSEGPDHCSDSVTSGSLVFGAIATDIGTIADLATAGESAREYNRAHGLDATLAPTAIRTPAGIVPGLGLVGQF